MSNLNNIDIKEILEVIQQRFPREYEIALQAVYIRNLEGAIADKGEFGVIEETED